MSDRPPDRLTRQLRQWARRPTRLSARVARTRVVARLGARRGRPWRLITTGATLAAGALALALVLGRPPAPVSESTPTAAPTAQRTIVHQLSSGTRMYIVVRPRTDLDER